MPLKQTICPVTGARLTWLEQLVIEQQHRKEQEKLSAHDDSQQTPKPSQLRVVNVRPKPVKKWTSALHYLRFRMRQLILRSVKDQAKAGMYFFMEGGALGGLFRTFHIGTKTALLGS